MLKTILNIISSLPTNDIKYKNSKCNHIKRHIFMSFMCFFGASLYLRETSGLAGLHLMLILIKQLISSTVKFILSAAM